MNKITVTPFDVRKNPLGWGRLPRRVKVMDGTKAAYDAVLNGKADIVLVNMEALCARHGYDIAQGETDQEKITRWSRAMDRDHPTDRDIRGILATPDLATNLHNDLNMIIETVRLNSSTLFVRPGLTRRYPRKKYSPHFDVEKAVANREEILYCTPEGYAAVFNGHMLHSWPARNVSCNHELEGPHLPAEGKVSYGFVRTWDCETLS